MVTTVPAYSPFQAAFNSGPAGTGGSTAAGSSAAGSSAAGSGVVVAQADRIIDRAINKLKAIQLAFLYIFNSFFGR
jgi:hypothetical protein